MNKKIKKGQYFHYTVGSYSDKNYYLLRALKDINQASFDQSNKIFQLINKILSTDLSCCENKNWTQDHCDNCKTRKSDLLFLSIMDILGYVEIVNTYGEVNIDTYSSNISETASICFVKSDINYEDDYEKVKSIVSKIINEDLGEIQKNG